MVDCQISNVHSKQNHPILFAFSSWIHVTTSYLSFHYLSNLQWCWSLCIYFSCQSPVFRASLRLLVAQLKPLFMPVINILMTIQCTLFSNFRIRMKVVLLKRHVNTLPTLTVFLFGMTEYWTKNKKYLLTCTIVQTWKKSLKISNCKREQKFY